MDGINTAGGSSSLDMFSFQLAPPGKEGEAFSNSATDIHGKVLGDAPGASQSSKDFAKHFGYSDKDTIDETKLEDVFQLGQQLNISILLNGSPDDVITFYLNSVDPSMPALAPIKAMLLITERQLQKGSLAGYQLFVSEANLQAANKKNKNNDPDGPGNDSAAFAAASLGVNPGGSLTHSGDNQAARDQKMSASAITRGIDSTDARNKAHALSSDVAAGAGNDKLDPNANPAFTFNTKDGNSGGTGGDNTGGSNSGNNSNRSTDTIESGSNSVSGSEYAVSGDENNAAISDGGDNLSAADAAKSITVTFQKISNGNPWLVGSPFVEFQIAFNELQRILMQNNIVQGKVELASMKMLVDIGHQAADAIMAIARMNQMIHIVAAVMAAVSMAMTIGCLALSVGAAAKSGVNKAGQANPKMDGGSKAGRILGFDSMQWNQIGMMGNQVEKMATAMVQAATDLSIAQKEGLKEILQAYKGIVQHTLDKATSAIRSNEEMIVQLLQNKDKMADSTQQAVAAALK